MNTKNIKIDSRDKLVWTLLWVNSFRHTDDVKKHTDDVKKAAKNVTYVAKMLSFILWWKSWLEALNLTLDNLKISKPARWSEVINELSIADDELSIKKALASIGMYNN
jgi:hypothetical protein